VADMLATIDALIREGEERAQFRNVTPIESVAVDRMFVPLAKF
jgi:hypothetical protein